MLRAVSNKALSEITSEWDALAPIRHQQIHSGDDISYNHVITPALFSILKRISADRILDAGCGTGAFTARLSEIATKIVGVDASEKSIEIAKKSNADRTSFVHDTLESFSLKNASSFDVVVANMVLMDVLSLDDFLSGCRRTLAERGTLVFSMTHPCFWPTYYGYASASWFRYDDEIIVESPFRISSDRIGSLVSTHIHRPLARYFQALKHAGFVLLEFEEPKPPSYVASDYLSAWKFPRYVVGRCVLDR